MLSYLSPYIEMMCGEVGGGMGGGVCVCACVCSRCRLGYVRSSALCIEASNLCAVTSN